MFHGTFLFFLTPPPPTESRVERKVSCSQQQQQQNFKKLEKDSKREPQPCRWVISPALPAHLDAFLSSFLNSCVHRAAHRKEERTAETGGWMKRSGAEGWGGGWKLGHEGEERQNKSPSEKDDASWLEKQRGDSLPSSLSPAFFSPLFLILLLSPVALLFFPASSSSPEIAHTGTHVIFCG